MSFFKINKIDTNNINFFNIINFFLNKNLDNIEDLENKIKNISYNIKNLGDKALLYYGKKFDNLNVNNIKDIKINKSNLEKCFYNLSLYDRYLLESCKNRIDIFHENQKNIFFKNWKFIESDGNFMGQISNPIENLGFYIPGGKALYPSSVFMNIAPSFDNKNVKKNVVTPISLIKDINKYNLILASLFLSNVDNVYNIGGSHSIFSLCYGTETVNKVDKIYGPGNIYVSLSKKIVFSETGIDMVAGPTEVTVLCDENANSDIIAMDIFSQCEHDELAQSIFISDNYEFINKLENSINKFLPLMYKKKIILNSIKNRSLFLKTNNLKESCNIINYISPEHLIVSHKNYNFIFKNLKNFGSLFLNKYTSESFGDYTSGVNHVLPTNKNSRFSSPLGVYDFFKKSNFLNISKLGFKKLKNITFDLGIKENLFSHSESLNLRLRNENL